MKSLTNIFNGCLRLLPAFVLLLGSCQKDITSELDYTVSDKDVTVSLPISLPKMDIATRNDISKDQLNHIRSLWVRTYSAISKQATSEWVKLTPDIIAINEKSQTVDIKTKSGSSYIIAVANVENLAIDKSDITATPVKLETLLEKANSWEQFLNIAVIAPSTYREINTVSSPLVMSGCYTNIPVGGKHPTRLDDWQTSNFQPIFIPANSDGQVALSGGAIHLRRLVSHLHFNIKAKGDIAITPQSYTICNVPRYTWLYERGNADNLKANVGDECTENNKTDYYTSSDEYTGQFFTINTKGKDYSFDFWQAENKHQALENSGCNTYDKREAEHKTPLGTEGEHNQTETNSGLYTSLTGEVWTPNNMASYVIIRCQVEYEKNINVDDNGQTTDPTDTNSVTRSGNAVYVIHLGYCEGADESAKSADFNCFRNTDYTYNINIAGIDKIRVEAYHGNETPGAEGIVSDVENATINLDAHYAAFNIQLTRDDLDNNFGYIITTYENGKEYTFEESDNVPNGQEKYINWIELRPTTDERTLATYKPRTYANEDERSFTLKDVADKKLSEAQYSTNDWYTVFVNEYTYESDSGDERYTGNGNPNWMGYVNQNPRQFYIRVTRSISADGNSTYARSKYAVVQQSIQTYYSAQEITPADGDISRGTAIGIERENESFGLNLRRYFTSGPDNNNSWDSSNGRYNVWHWVQNGKTDSSWKNFIDETKPQEIKESKNQGGIAARTIANGNPVKLPKLADYSSSMANEYFTSTRNNPNGTNKLNAKTTLDPQPSSNNPEDYIEAINACMNRNRDNNGNGIIDLEELRWYVPATGKYLRIILGRKSLTDPIMDYENINNLTESANGRNSRYMFFTSDGRVLWGMEGMSTSFWGQWGDSDPAAPWQVRCIRNLGTNLSTVEKGEKVVPAYIRDKDNERIIHMTYYDLNSIRTTPYSGNWDYNSATDANNSDKMPIHSLNQDYNMIYKSFEYSEGANVTNSGFAYDAYSNKTASSIFDYIKTNPCSNLGKGWRIPNQKELAIMRNLKLFDNMDKDNTYAISCTTGFFNDKGVGGNYVDGQTDRRLMIVRHDAATQLSPDWGSVNIYVRCVRDVD